MPPSVTPLAWLTRRTRTLAQQTETLTAGLFIVGCFYNLCDAHHSLRLRLSVGQLWSSLGTAHTGHRRRSDRPYLDSR